MPRVREQPPQDYSAGRTPAERIRFHASRWGLLVAVSLVARVAFPLAPAGSDLAGIGAAFLGPLLYDSVVLSMFWLLLLFYRRETYAAWRELAFLASLFALVIVLSAIFARLFPGRPELLPAPFAAVIITVLYNGRLSVFAAATLAILIGGQPGLPGYAILWALAGGIGAALSVRVVRRRSEIYVAILGIALAEGVAAIAVGLRSGWSGRELLTSFVAGGVAAFGCAAVAMLLLPVAESLTGITTDFTLLELSDPSRPLLRRLATEAAGTYAHSVAMANVCEAACHAIGANGLLARVGCYYHDIGKLKAPQYFVENQIHGANHHDRLKPDESARIIRDHVHEGLALAEEAHLPAAVRAFIPEHHGTSRIDYFFDRAVGGRGAVSADDAAFRYPGPRPRSAETAIAMLADSTEAALRALDEPTPGRLREAIEHLVEHKVASGQLRDTPLTLRDLDRITEEFVRIMHGVYHNRVDYPSASGGISGEFRRG
jgi:putative nucleotidyltransferase with HDIG domain